MENIAVTHAHLPRFTSSYAVGVAPAVRFQVIHNADGDFVTAYAGSIKNPRVLSLDDLFEDDKQRVLAKLKAIKDENERKSNAWPWPTSDNPPRVKQVVTNCWPFPVSTPPIEPDDEEQKRADDEIDAQHDADIKQADALRQARMLAVVHYLDAWLPQRTQNPHNDLVYLAAEVKDEPHALSDPHHIYYDTYNDAVKIIVSLDHTHIHYQIAVRYSDTGGGAWMPNWLAARSAERKAYDTLGQDIMMVSTLMNDADFQRNVDLCIKPLVDAVYKAAE